MAGLANEELKGKESRDDRKSNDFAKKELVAASGIKALTTCLVKADPRFHSSKLPESSPSRILDVRAGCLGSPMPAERRIVPRAHDFYFFVFTALLQRPI